MKDMDNFKKSNFSQDLKGEKIVGQFLDDVFYKSAFKNFRRTDVPSEQFDGIDVVVQCNNGLFKNFDEKVQLTKLGNPTPSFAFEVSFLNKNGEIKPGWLFKENSTDYFLLGYFNLMNSNVKVLTSRKQIRQFEFVIVSKLKVIKFLIEQGFNEEFLISEANKLKNTIDSGKNEIDGYEKGETGYRKRLMDGVSVFYSTSFAEKPLNVVIHRKHLDILAEKIVRITNETNVEILK